MRKPWSRLAEQPVGRRPRRRSRGRSSTDELRPSFSSSRVISTSVARRGRTPRRRAPTSSPGRCARRARNVPAERGVRDPLLRARDAPAAVDPLGARERARRRPSRRRARSARSADRARRARAAARTARAAPRSRTASSGSVQAEVCTATVTPTPASARDSSSSTSTYERKSAPAPPYSSGTQTPSSPSSASVPSSCARESVRPIPLGGVRLDLGARRNRGRATGSHAAPPSARSPRAETIGMRSAVLLGATGRSSPVAAAPTRRRRSRSCTRGAPRSTANDNEAASQALRRRGAGDPRAARSASKPMPTSPSAGTRASPAAGGSRRSRRRAGAATCSPSSC